MLRPVPPSMLAQTAVWREPEDREDGAGGSFGEPRETSRVLFQERRQRSTGGYSEQYQRYEGPSGLLVIDARNSDGGVPPVGALVSIDGGREMPVRSVSVLRDRRGRVHHYELEVG